MADSGNNDYGSRTIASASLVRSPKIFHPLLLPIWFAAPYAAEQRCQMGASEIFLPLTRETSLLSLRFRRLRSRAKHLLPMKKSANDHGNIVVVTTWLTPISVFCSCLLQVCCQPRMMDGEGLLGKGGRR
ncbi:hypothetical protein L484_019055 [Morus notabilis]|uniref:Uncharacterized protein n=1 Tax=Morus notabilis TaxID=981085 RepID=W9R283_9ROSA|nr:hypothetical protein L484_019055 [Morus notabilis]